MTKRLSTALSAIVLLAFAGCAATPEPAPPPPPPAPAPRPVAPPPPPAPAPKAEKITTASTVNFDFDRYVIRPDARSKLDDLVGKLRSVNLEVIIAVGHADRIGSDAYNMKLSVRRADSVKAYLVSKGIAASRIYTEGKGERQPVKECKGDKKTRELIACLEPNRRVESEAVGSATK
ncbi:MAG: OmpA family protein [Betaproteobacteria bacterium]|nr:MAG: OmpA family protein [Betaproteobacteria bacterium]